MKRLILGVLAPALISLLFYACKKTTESQLVASEPLAYNQAGDVLSELQKVTNASLFYRGFKKLGIVNLLSKDAFYTVFIPTDSAMIAAGYTEKVLDQMPPAELQKIITYHIVKGAVDRTAFKSQVTTMVLPTLKTDTTLVQGQGLKTQTALLSISERGALRLNGLPVNEGESAVPFSNGLIYVVKRVATEPKNSVWDIVKSETDLSLYYAALQISDSISLAMFKEINPYVTDDFTNQYLFELKLGTLLSNQFHYNTSGIAVLAPTNTAFNKAGFYTVNDIRTYALRTTAVVYYDPETFQPAITYSPIDSLLKHHLLLNHDLNGDRNHQSGPFGAYQKISFDDLKDARINNGVFNVFKLSYSQPSSLSAFGPLILPVQELNFSVQANRLYVQWNREQPNEPAYIEQDKNAAEPVRNFIATNGTLNKIDQLFYPYPVK